jgi:hypothetical protein
MGDKKMTERDAALLALCEAADKLPKHVPSHGGAATKHSFKIEAGVIWDLDRAVRRARAALAADPAEEVRGYCFTMCETEGPGVIALRFGHHPSLREVQESLTQLEPSKMRQAFLDVLRNMPEWSEFSTHLTYQSYDGQVEFRLSRET